MLTTQQIKLYAIIEKKKQDDLINLGLANVGFIAGTAQALGGGVVCFESAGAACAKYGVPNVIQGLNNVYENCYYIIFRESTSGTVRDAYRYVVGKFGGSNNTADLIYGTVDIGLTATNYTKLVLLPREKSWSLFRHIQTDFIRGWKEVGALGYTIDGFGTLGTGYQMYQIRQKQQLEQAAKQEKAK